MARRRLGGEATAGWRESRDGGWPGPGWRGGSWVVRLWLGGEAAAGWRDRGCVAERRLGGEAAAGWRGDCWLTGRRLGGEAAAVWWGGGLVSKRIYSQNKSRCQSLASNIFTNILLIYIHNIDI